MAVDFARVRERRHDEARAWKERTGGKVIGLFCCDVPEEIIHAAGMLPVRLLGEHEPASENALELDHGHRQARLLLPDHADQGHGLRRPTGRSRRLPFL